MDGNFQKVVLILAIVALIIILGVIGGALSHAKENTNWPPIIGECPDYWVDMSGNGEACYNKHSLGKCNVPSKDNQSVKNFNEFPFVGNNSECAKYRWANACDVTWDGITSGVKNPCDAQPYAQVTKSN